MGHPVYDFVTKVRFLLRKIFVTETKVLFLLIDFFVYMFFSLVQFVTVL